MPGPPGMGGPPGGMGGPPGMAGGPPGMTGGPAGMHQHPGMAGPPQQQQRAKLDPNLMPSAVSFFLVVLILRKLIRLGLKFLKNNDGRGSGLALLETCIAAKYVGVV